MSNKISNAIEAHGSAGNEISYIDRYTFNVA